MFWIYVHHIHTLKWYAFPVVRAFGGGILFIVIRRAGQSWQAKDFILPYCDGQKVENIVIDEKEEYSKNMWNQTQQLWLRMLGGVSLQILVMVEVAWWGDVARCCICEKMVAALDLNFIYGYSCSSISSQCVKIKLDNVTSLLDTKGMWVFVKLKAEMQDSENVLSSI